MAMTSAAHGAHEAGSRPESFVGRLRKFLKSSSFDKSLSIAFRVRRWFPRAHVPLRLWWGVWWIAEDSSLDRTLLGSRFEDGEAQFVRKFLRPGMTVVDIGAHHGFYTLLASKKVGSKGRVIAFEPSPRERHRLAHHLRLNFRRNVSVEPFAVGERRSESQFFVVDGNDDWLNSLRQPSEAGEHTHCVTVGVLALDGYLREKQIAAVDFLKIDVEGGERDVIRGAAELLGGRSRPVILAEVSDLRTKAWGYPAREIVFALEQHDYRLFAVSQDGSLAEIRHHSNEYDENVVAIPAEQVSDVLGRFSSS